MNTYKSQLIISGFALIPYLLVVWGYTEFTDGHLKTFWIALGALFGIRFFFSLIETLGGILAWRLHSKKFTVETMLQMFHSNEFPMREYQHDDLGNYLARIEDSEKVSPSIKRTAKDLEKVLEMCENQGRLIGARMYSATETALDIYSPKSKAKEFPFSQ